VKLLCFWYELLSNFLALDGNSAMFNAVYLFILCNSVVSNTIYLMILRIYLYIFIFCVDDIN
jgi:hypothetical protein